MPKFKEVKITDRNEAGAVASYSFTVNVNADGKFYFTVPPEFVDLFEAQGAAGREGGYIREKNQVFADTFKEIEQKLVDAVRALCACEVTEEHVILYQIETRVSFAVDGDGAVFPNASFPGTRWMLDKERYGEFNNYQRHAGYSLRIAARAKTKKTYSYGNKKRVEYENYYAGGDHLHPDTGAALLNSWAHIEPYPEHAMEIPYTEEAALFFHKMITSMVELARSVQSATFDQSALLRMIKAGAGVPMLSAPARGE